MTAAGTRARVRAALTREIVDAARRHLAVDGAAGLSLRAVARELGMASSAVYRYFPSRDDLLTALIVDAYDALGAAAEEAEAAGAAGGPAGAAARGLRRGPRLGAGPPARVRAGLRLAGARLRGAAGDRRAGGARRDRARAGSSPTVSRPGWSTGDGRHGRPAHRRASPRRWVCPPTPAGHWGPG